MSVLLSALSFETLFKVPPQHRLVQVLSRSRGGLISGTFCEHEEYDTNGRLIARFDTFNEIGSNRQHKMRLTAV
jgi:hypothetical protein